MMEYILKYLVIGIVVAFLSSCSDFVPMSPAEGEAFKACLDKDMVPLFKENKGPELTPFTFGVTLLRF